MRVPVECFYLRCGAFSNFQWLTRFLDKWGARARDLASSRGVDYDIRDRIQRQLALRETVMARLFGETVVADVAIIGTDTFFREGAAIGILFQAKNNDLLAGQISRNRQAAIRADAAVTEKIVKIGGRDVSLLARPDNLVRSFYVADGDYHLVATSRVLTERFLEAGAGKASLGQSPEFRFARHKVPLSRNDTVFVYLSDPFFRNIIGPHYRVEMTRRMRALGKIELVYLAQLAARAEGKKLDTVKDLIDGGLLRPGFQDEPDGGRTVLRGGWTVDSIRGARGAFLPVPDVKIAGITPAEADAYQQYTDDYRRLWEKIDPVIVGVGRSAGKAADTERIAVDLCLTPYVRKHYEPLEEFLPRLPDLARVAAVEGDIGSLQAVIWPRELMAGGDVLGPLKNMVNPMHRVFGGLRDFPVPYKINRGEMDVDDDDIPKAVRGYAGESPLPLLSPWIVSGWGKADKEGYNHNEEDDLWYRAVSGFCVLSTRKETLQAVTPLLKLEKAERPAQIRLNVKDLRRTKLADMIRSAAYLRTRKVSAGNVYLIHSLIRQFNVAPREGMAAAQRLLGARLVCPLGQGYKLDEGPAATWSSAEWETRTMHEISRIPEGFRFDGLEWFRRLQLEFTLDVPARTLKTHVELDIAAEPGS